MDIHSRGAWPSKALSNFAPHPFIYNDVDINSMEGFLQGLKFKSVPMQREVCKLVGRAAKAKGAKKKWQTKGLLWWNGVAYDRYSSEYNNLLYDVYYSAIKQNEGFRRALLATKGMSLTHSIGKKKPKDTIITESEFCSILRNIREILFENDGILP